MIGTDKESPEQSGGIEDFSLKYSRMRGNKSPTPHYSTASCEVVNRKKFNEKFDKGIIL
jgi:hypothetical protein